MTFKIVKSKAWRTATIRLIGRIQAGHAATITLSAEVIARLGAIGKIPASESTHVQ